MGKELIKAVLPLLSKAALLVSIGTLIGYYFPDLTPKALVVWVPGYLAVKYLSSFHWFGAILAFIFTAGIQNTGGHVPAFVFGKSLVTIVLFFAMCHANANHSQGRS